MVLITIGVGIIMAGTGLFVGKYLTETEFFKKKQEERAFKKELQRIAKEQALKEAMPEMVKRYKEEEIKKMTGEYRKEKMEKFANAFKMGDTNNDMFNPNKILGNTNSGQMSGLNNQNNDYFNPEKILGKNNTNESDRLAKMMGGFNTGYEYNKPKNNKKKPTVNEEEEKIKRILGLK